MLATIISNHVQQALQRLIQQYVGLPRLSGLLTAIVDQIQDLENAAYDTNETRQLYNGSIYPAVGAQLDGIGQIVGIARNGQSDAEYLTLILGKIGENFSDTTQNQLMNIVRTVFQASSVFVQTPNTPGSPGHQATVGFGVGSPQVDPSLYPLIEQIIENSIGAGIALMYLISFSEANPLAFSMAGPQAWVGGFSDALNPQASDPVWSSAIFTNLET
jgi:hypothetical protein